MTKCDNLLIEYLADDIITEIRLPPIDRIEITTAVANGMKQLQQLSLI
ncbi:hypothetical protein [Argonema galeatum]|nr:hypothetical protein [Argonema galeatum]MCL1465641.1 hypothetical protein [Argonema galeatum A003/A1]